MRGSEDRRGGLGTHFLFLLPDLPTDAPIKGRNCAAGARADKRPRSARRRVLSQCWACLHAWVPLVLAKCPSGPKFGRRASAKKMCARAPCGRWKNRAGVYDACPKVCCADRPRFATNRTAEGPPSETQWKSASNSSAPKVRTSLRYCA